MPARVLSTLSLSGWRMDESPYSVFLIVLFVLNSLVILYEAGFLIRRIYRHLEAKKRGRAHEMKEEISISGLKYSISFLFIFLLFLLIPILKENEEKSGASIERNQQAESESPFKGPLSGETQNKLLSIENDPIELYSYNDCVYALYNVEEEWEMPNGQKKKVKFPALFLLQKNKEALRLSKNYCIKLDFLEDKLIFLESLDDSIKYGKLRCVGKDAKVCELSIDEVLDFTCQDGSIYYKYRQASIVGDLKEHGLYRADLDGSEATLVAYPIDGSNFKFEFNELDRLRIEDGYISNDKGKMKLGNPATGMEEIVITGDYKFDWIYYASNRLIKAKPDGSERIILDDLLEERRNGTEPYIDIDLIDDEWIYYTVSGIKYKIDKNGEHKTLIRD